MIEKSDFFWWKLELDFFYELQESLYWKLDTLGIKCFSIEVFTEEEPFNQTLVAWLPSYEWSQKDKDQLELTLKSLAIVFNKQLVNFKWEKIYDQDWSSSWKDLWKPDPVGEKILILPSWLDVPEIYAERVVVKLDPGSAFGTGSHPTTRLCLEALQRNPPVGLKIADVGCGSGILGIAALGLGAIEVKAVDVDPLSVRATTENALLNNLTERQLSVALGSIEVLEKQLNKSKVDLLVCNILASTIKQLAPDFFKVACLQSRLFLSGILVDQIEDITNVLSSFNWEFVALYRLDEWALIELCRNPQENR